MHIPKSALLPEFFEQEMRGNNIFRAHMKQHFDIPRQFVSADFICNNYNVRMFRKSRKPAMKKTEIVVGYINFLSNYQYVHASTARFLKIINLRIKKLSNARRMPTMTWATMYPKQTTSTKKYMSAGLIPRLTTAIVNESET